jgi:hypothetical protein
LIVERVEHDTDEIVVPRRIAIAQIRTYLAGVRIARVEPDHEPGPVLDQVDECLDRRGLVLTGTGLDVEHEDERVAPNSLVEHAVDHYRSRRVRDVGCRHRVRGTLRHGFLRAEHGRPERDRRDDAQGASSRSVHEPSPRGTPINTCNGRERLQLAEDKSSAPFPGVTFGPLPGY